MSHTSAQRPSWGASSQFLSYALRGTRRIVRVRRCVVGGQDHVGISTERLRLGSRDDTSTSASLSWSDVARPSAWSRGSRVRPRSRPRDLTHEFPTVGRGQCAVDSDVLVTNVLPQTPEPTAWLSVSRSRWRASATFPHSARAALRSAGSASLRRRCSSNALELRTTVSSSAIGEAGLRSRIAGEGTVTTARAGSGSTYAEGRSPPHCGRRAPARTSSRLASQSGQNITAPSLALPQLRPCGGMHARRSVIWDLSLWGRGLCGRSPRAIGRSVLDSFRAGRVIR